jgi:hypothetical protein
MKIGLVLFGNLRSFRSTLSSFSLLKKTLEQTGTVDIFCHTWDIEESVTSSWWKDHKTSTPPPATVNREEIEEAYQPVKLSIESSIQFDDSAFKINSSIPVAGILSMLHTQRRAYELLQQHESQNNFRYDVVIKTRFDLLYEIAPEFNNLLIECYKQNCVYLPSSNPYELSGANSDIFAMGSGSEMEKYFSFCNNFKQAADIYFEEGYRQLIPELCMTVYLQHKGVAKRELTGMRLHILRMNNEKFQINSDRNFSSNMPQCFFTGTIEANLQVFSGKKDVLEKNSKPLVKKYMSWVDNEAGDEALEKYADFYNGEWIGIAAVSKLAVKGKNNTLFTPNVMENFFEEAFYNARYGSFRKFLLASLLMQKNNYGLFFFKVWRNRSVRKNKL